MEIVVFRSMSDDTLKRSNVPGLMVEQVCRVGRAAADLTRTAGGMARDLRRRAVCAYTAAGAVFAAGIPAGRGRAIVYSVGAAGRAIGDDIGVWRAIGDDIGVWRAIGDDIGVWRAIGDDVAVGRAMGSPAGMVVRATDVPRRSARFERPV